MIIHDKQLNCKPGGTGILLSGTRTLNQTALSLSIACLNESAFPLSGEASSRIPSGLPGLRPVRDRSPHHRDAAGDFLLYGIFKGRRSVLKLQQHIAVSIPISLGERCGSGRAFAEGEHSRPLPQEGVCLKTRFGGFRPGGTREARFPHQGLQ